ncbi:MAG: 4-hydroxy-tetrahydrodipicolinate reductase [Endomicrobium sp.]|jgi:4-hydroxy-tetrahydrodipicolinate reductase|nr:4-hydroxy-tetrahydrodipicolinate reductase [Endomicrobium sp.]
MKITVCGAAGRMGQTILTMSKKDTDIQIFGALDLTTKKKHYNHNSNIISIKNLQKFLKKTDVIIDFSTPTSTLNNLKLANKYHIPVVIGTTGFDKVQIRKITEFSKNIPIVLSPNMSIGINILFKLIEIILEKNPNYDVNIIELHHNKKKDSPSGTAIMFSKIVTAIKNGRLYIENPDNKILKNEVGIFSLRSGDIVGDHSLYFVGDAERIELTHRVQSRDAFAIGAIKAAKWLVKQRVIGLYDMCDVLNLK